MSYGLGITPEEAQKFIDSYFINFPKVKEFQDKAKNTIKVQKFVQTITKRRRRFKDYNRVKIPAGSVPLTDMEPDQRKRLYREREINDKALERQAGNALIQGSAADIMNIAMRNMDKKLKALDAHLIIQIHDEVLVECPKDKAEEAVAIIKFEMENAVKLPGVPLVAEPKITECWEK